MIEAETGPIEPHNRIVATDEIDTVTQEVVIEILRAQEGHRRRFESSLWEHEIESGA